MGNPIPEETPTQPDSPVALSAHQPPARGRHLPDYMASVSRVDVYQALRQAWIDMKLSAVVTREAILVLVAHWALETDWGRACHAYNLGNIKYSDGCGYDFVMFACTEDVDGQMRWVRPPDPGCRFRAYLNLDEGTRDYLTRLQDEFKEAWPAVLSGDPKAFSHLLAVSHYYTAPEAQYTADIVSIFGALNRTEPPDPDVGDLARAALEESSLIDVGQPTPPSDLTPG